MNDNEKEKADEIKRFSHRRAEQWYDTAAQLNALIRHMEDIGIDYGAAYTAIAAAREKATQTAAGYWADYKTADKIASGGKPTLYNSK